ncbi:MAG: dibenzofuran dioxygenase subunit alpha [Pseudonocardiales bacterium]|nr:dibenzofuran dioxygenase subunit alpha [Pseudonocardiales bacterium]
MSIATTDLAGLVQPAKGTVSRQVYVDQGIYDHELERIFTRSWLFLGHTSQLAQPGDFLTTYMGEDPVIVARGKDGQVRAMLNSCRHRGMRVCRSDEGNTSFFRCPYHAWTYSNTGELTGVPKFRLGYGGVLDKKEWGLLEVPRVEEYGGFLFGNWDAGAVPLTEWLGDFRLYCDLVFGRDPEGVEFVGGVHKWSVSSNWKIPTENFACDMYHVAHSHARSMEIGLLGPSGDDGYEIAAGMGFLGNGFGPPASADAEGAPVHPMATMATPYSEHLAAQRARVAERYSQEMSRVVPGGHGNVFPNFAFLDIELLRLVRVHHPEGPGSHTVHQWCVVDKSLPAEVKDALRRQYTLTFGPSGMLEQDDGENFRECQASMRGVIGRRMENNLMLGLGQDRTGAEIVGDGDAPGAGGGIWSEANQRRWYEHWLSFMTGQVRR